MKTVALLTGRGNNSLPDKNIIEILGKPVLYYPAHAAKEAKEIDDWYVSSDDEKILRIAGAEGYKPIVRPDELALPTSQHIECILHALQVMKEQDVHPDILVVLLANNVTIKSKWIDDCVQILKNNPELTSVVPVYEDRDHHPLRAKSVDGEGLLEMYEKDVPSAVSTNRQDLPKCVFLAHNFWVLRVDTITDKNGQLPWSFMGKRIYPYYIEKSIDIHDQLDLHIAKAWLTLEKEQGNRNDN